MKHVAVMGYGTVGSGVYEVLTKNKDVVSKNVGEELNVKYVLDLREFPGDPVSEVLTHNFDDILTPDIDYTGQNIDKPDPIPDFQINDDEYEDD